MSLDISLSNATCKHILWLIYLKAKNNNNWSYAMLYLEIHSPELESVNDIVYHLWNLTKEGYIELNNFKTGNPLNIITLSYSITKKGIEYFKS